MQSNEGRIRESQKVPTKVKEVAMAALLLCAGGSALAWGVGQMYRPTSSTPSPNDQCRMLANAFLAGDTDLVFEHVNSSDAKHLSFKLSQLKAFQDKMLSPRLGAPVAWRPRHNRVIACHSDEGIISLHLSDPKDTRRFVMSLVTQMEGDKITYRYDDLLRVLSNLDKNSGLTREQKYARMREDAEAMALTGLPGFSQLHPGPEAESIWKEAVNRKELAQASARQSSPQPGFKRLTPLAID